MVRGQRQADKKKLFAANGSIIKTYGHLAIQPDFGLRRSFLWRFIVADVNTPIIGSDFLAHFHLLPDVKKEQLMKGRQDRAENTRNREQSYNALS